MVPMQRHRERGLERLVNPVDTITGGCKGQRGHRELTCPKKALRGPRFLHFAKQERLTAHILDFGQMRSNTELNSNLRAIHSPFSTFQLRFPKHLPLSHLS